MSHSPTDVPAARPADSARWVMDPRRSLAAAVMWLIIALAVTYSTAAAMWVGSIARRNVLEQHVRRFALETEQMSSEFGQAVAARLGAVRAARALSVNAAASPQTGLSGMYAELKAAYPELDWIAIADLSGMIVAADGALPIGSRVDSASWFAAGLKRPWLGIIEDLAEPARQKMTGTSVLGDLAVPVEDRSGRVIGVIVAHVSRRRAPDHPMRLTDESDPQVAAQAYVLDRTGTVLIGPAGTRGQPWTSTPVRADDAAAPHFERLPSGGQILLSRSPMSASGVAALNWQVQLCEPQQRVYQRADALALRILWVSLALGAATAVLGVIGTLQLTRRLRRLDQSVAAVGRNAASGIEVPQGLDEVAKLARGFAKILDDLQRERRELKSLSGELERRVVVRTREVERLAEENRYAAIVRERLKIARDLHDTLAHSMMAMLSEIRFLRKLHSHDPGAVAAELAHAEQVAHEGLKEARNAITQVRVNAVRETGLGPALSREFDRFVDRTGLTGEFTADADAARFGDERAETILRMAQEALRNVERHAGATRVIVALRAAGGNRLEMRIEDNGIGFDPQILIPDHYGILGLREQAELIGAELDIDSTPGTGTRLIVWLSLSPIAFGAGQHP